MTREKREVSIEQKLRGSPFISKHIYTPGPTLSPTRRFDLSVYKPEKVASFKVVTKEQLLGPRGVAEFEGQVHVSLADDRGFGGSRGWGLRH